ncbi:putative glycosidase [Saccharolobus shibatae B12]|uniref:Glycosidase n=3 Tax=Saccharolobus TaxID=2100760 RepID=A0A8F5GTR6_SACSH|nr:GH116 family glycosyl hydrolase [Saccharolobus shibatae]QXJ29175.1 putative glycosidase [Saccharolobus shibatae B12]
MVVFTSDEKLISLPLGGIGAGKVEISNKGKLVNLTIANNWTKPIREMPGFHIFVKPNNREPFFLQSELIFLELNKLSTRLRYEGLYPFVRIKGSKDGIDAEVEAFSPIIPSDLLNSSLPAVGFTVKINVEGLIVISISNICGMSKIGRYNEKIEKGIIMKNSKANEYDPFNGDITLISDSPKIIVPQYNFHSNRGLEKTLNLHRLIENEEPWKQLILDKIPNSDSKESTGYYYLPTGLIGAEGREVTFVFAWYFNKPWAYYPYKHYYSNYFSNSTEVAKYFLDNFDKLKHKTKEWQENLIDPSLPEWLKDAIINSTYIFSTSTWLDEKGRFGIYEAPEIGPMLSTIGGVCYETGSLPTVLMFPQLERSTLDLFMKAMREDGYIPHDLGLHSLDTSSDGTTAPPKWKDTNPTFILMAYRYYLRTKDTDFLSRIYPYLITAMEWMVKQDFNEDGLPEVEGSCDTGYDCVPMEGISSYVASLYIASLMALVEIGKILGDQNAVNRYSSLLTKGKKSLPFDGKKFVAWTGKPDHHNAVFMAQIFGEWWVYLLNLDHISDINKVETALDEIYRVNGSASNFCTPNMAREDGGEVNIDSQLTSSWPRLVFSVSALAYAYGKREWLNIAKKEWDNLVRKGLPWNQPSLIHAEDGEPDDPFLDHYIGSAALWSFTYKYALSKLIDNDKI